MKKNALVVCFIFFCSLCFSQSFTPGNIVVVRIGTGSAVMVQNVAQSVFLDEYNPAGVLVQTIAMPTATAGSNYKLTLPVSTDYSEGYISLSQDGKYLALAGYDELVGADTVSTSLSTLIKRVVAVVDANGTVNTATALNTFNKVAIRSAVVDGNNIWLGGASGGIMYTTIGATTQSLIAATTGRCVEIFNGQLYASSNSGTLRMTTVGTGLPTTGGQTMTQLNSYPTNGSPYQFYLADQSTTEPGLDVLYIADNNQLRKYSKVSGVWTANGLIGTTGDRYRGVTGQKDINGNIVLYCTRKNAYETMPYAGGEIVSITDNTGYNVSFASITPVLIAQAPTNTVFRGVAMAPGTDVNTKTWIGGSIGAVADWATANNWVGKTLPAATSNVYIPVTASTANKPVISSGTYTVASMNIATGTDLTIDNTSVVNVTDSITNTAVIKGTGKLSLIGSSTQKIKGAGTYSNLEINNAAGATLNSSIAISRSLLPTVGVLALGNNDITLLSDATATAQVATAAAATPFTYGTGNFIMQRYIPGDKRAFRFFGHPFTNTLNLSSLTDNILITGGTGTNGFTPSGTNAPSSFWYNVLAGNESTTNDIGWTAFNTTDGSGTGNTWQQYQGIRTLVRGSISDGLSPVTPSAVTIDVKGQLNTGDQVIALTKGTNSGYNFIGNPFAAAIDLNTTGGNVVLGSNVVTNYYVWNITPGTKGVWDNRSFSSSYILPSLAGFFVKVAANSSITIKENAKSTAAATGTLYRNATSGIQFVRLQVTDDKHIAWDKTELYFDSKSTNNTELNDGVKMLNSEINFSSISNDNKKLSIDTRPFVDDGTIPLSFTSLYKQQFFITVSDLDITDGVELYLKDKYLNTETKLVAGLAYAFDVTADAATQGDNRFELLQKKAKLQPLSIAINEVLVYPNPATDKVQVSFTNEEETATVIQLVSANGQSIKTVDAGSVKSGTVTMNTKNIAKGTYYIVLDNGKHKTTKQLQIQ